MAIPRNSSPLLQTNARRLRRNLTPHERSLWQFLRSRKLRGYKFRRQAIVVGSIVDFYCPKLKLVIELDGSLHDTEADARRDQALRAHGLTVLRFPNSQPIPEILAALEAFSASKQLSLFDEEMLELSRAKKFPEKVQPDDWYEMRRRELAKQTLEISKFRRQA